jgi:hypothetical protein
VWLEIKHITTFVDHKERKRETREGKCSLTFVKEMDLL